MPPRGGASRCRRRLPRPAARSSKRPNLQPRTGHVVASRTRPDSPPRARRSPHRGHVARSPWMDYRPDSPRLARSRSGWAKRPRRAGRRARFRADPFSERRTRTRRRPRASRRRPAAMRARALPPLPPPSSSGERKNASSPGKRAPSRTLHRRRRVPDCERVYARKSDDALLPCYVLRWQIQTTHHFGLSRPVRSVPQCLSASSPPSRRARRCESRVWDPPRASPDPPARRSSKQARSRRRACTRTASPAPSRLRGHAQRRRQPLSPRFALRAPSARAHATARAKLRSTSSPRPRFRRPRRAPPARLPMFAPRFPRARPRRVCTSP